MSPSLDLALESAAQRYLEGAPDKLRESIRYSLLAPGKRIRPRLALASSQMMHLSESAALPPALAIEMIHCFTLIHDDLPCMDNDDFRRGKPTNHKVYGESLALLAGDALLTMAFEVLTEASAHVPAQNFVQGLQRLLRCSGPRGVAGGQALEMTLGEHAALDRLEQVHRAKTGALFEASILVPADFAGVQFSTDKGQAVEIFARALGFGFQIADDLEDLRQDTIKDSRAGTTAPPSNIRFFKSANQAGEEAARMLRDASEKVAILYGTESGPLLSIAHEVIQKLHAEANA